jgi:hypothetical protein
LMAGSRAAGPVRGRRPPPDRTRARSRRPRGRDVVGRLVRLTGSWGRTRPHVELVDRAAKPLAERSREGLG